jgi:FkbM family methyltransferase
MYTPLRKRLSRALRGKLRAMAFSNHGIAVIADSKNGVLAVDPRDYGVARALLARGSYDWSSICWLLKLLNADANSRMVFVGAHIGALLVPLAIRSGSRHVVAFEPAPHNHRLLRMNLVLNGLLDVTVHQMAVGASAGRIQFTENLTNTGNSRVSSSGEVVVQMTTLDAGLPSGWVHTDLLIMDTEGFEVQALRGAARSLRQTRYLYVEYCPEQLAEQGGTPAQFIELVADQFQSMYLPGAEVRFFPGKTYVQHLKSLPDRGGLLLNLLFTNDNAPTPQLLDGIV